MSRRDGLGDVISGSVTGEGKSTSPKMQFESEDVKAFTIFIYLAQRKKYLLGNIR